MLKNPEVQAGRRIGVGVAMLASSLLVAEQYQPKNAPVAELEVATGADMPLGSVALTDCVEQPGDCSQETDMALIHNRRSRSSRSSRSRRGRSYPTKPIPKPDPSKDSELGTHLGRFESTCYDLPPKGNRGGPGSIAVDPKVIPMGTSLYVEGWGHGAARDTGGAIKGGIVDVWKPKGQCREWGRRMVDVWDTSTPAAHTSEPEPQPAPPPEAPPAEPEPPMPYHIA